jgi:ParB family chromosome partitioning protein
MTHKRRIFGISKSLSRGLSETISIVENNTGIFRNTVIPVSRVEADPDNPRRLLITPGELLKGPNKDDPMYNEKRIEHDKLKELSSTIISKGLMQPVIVYKHDDKYRVIAGNRRFYASIMAGKSEIEARILDKRPSKIDHKLIQWIENTARDDLSLSERIENIKGILGEYKKINENVQVTSTLLADIIGLSLTQAKYYLSVIRAEDDLQKVIYSGQIQSLDKANLIANIKSPELRKSAIEKCIEGASLKALKSFISKEQHAIAMVIKNQFVAKSKGRVATRVNLGVTLYPEIAKQIIYAILDKPEYKSFSKIFSDVDWSQHGQASQAFRNLIEILEKQRR